MKQSRSLFLLGVAFTLAKHTSEGIELLYEGVARINEQINYLEEIITMYPIHYLNDTLMVGGVEVPGNLKGNELRELRKCIARIQSEVNKDLTKHNVLMRRVMNSCFLGDDLEFEGQEDLDKDYIRYLMENKFLYLTAIPAYLKKIFTKLNLTIDDKDMKAAEKMLQREQIKGTEQILNITKLFGLEEDDIPF